MGIPLKNPLIKYCYIMIVQDPATFVGPLNFQFDVSIFTSSQGQGADAPTHSLRQNSPTFGWKKKFELYFPY